MKKTTLQNLLEEYPDQVLGAVPLKAVCKKYLGLSFKTAQAAAKASKLPVPCHRIGATQKAPWLVNLADLAAMIDASQAQAKLKWEKANTVDWPIKIRARKKGGA